MYIYEHRCSAELYFRGQYFEKHLKFIHHNMNAVTFTNLDLSYLLKVCHSTFIHTLVQADVMSIIQDIIRLPSFMYEINKQLMVVI